jgi:hypothetical protein
MELLLVPVMVIPFHDPLEAVSVPPLPTMLPLTASDAPDGNDSVVAEFKVSVTAEATVSVPAIGQVPEGIVMLSVTEELL